MRTRIFVRMFPTYHWSQVTYHFRLMALNSGQVGSK